MRTIIPSTESATFNIEREEVIVLGGGSLPLCWQRHPAMALSKEALEAADDIRTFMMSEEAFAFPENRERIAAIIERVVAATVARMSRKRRVDAC